MNDCSLKNLCLYFLKLGTTGFGGPAALVSYMEKDLVEDRGWIAEDEYKEGFTLAQLAPGPLAAQLAIYLGWVRYKNLGATLCGLAFVLPSFLMCLFLAWFYIRFQNLPWIQPIFYTVGASVIGIIALSSQKLAKKAVGKDKLLLLMWLISAVATAITENEEIWFFLLAGLITMLWQNPHLIKNKKASFVLFPFLFLGINGVSNSKTTIDILLFFTKAGAFVFGSGLAIVPFLHSGVVNDYHWLTEQQFLDAVAVAMITPGPVVITVAFIGFLVSGFAGAVLASIGTFLPCYLFTVIPAPYFSKYAKNPYLKSFISGVTAAAIGAIAGACWVLGKRAIIDVTTFSIAAITIGVLLKTKIREPIVILFFSFVGFILFWLK
jgi:chromate transporter